MVVNNSGIRVPWFWANHDDGNRWYLRMVIVHIVVMEIVKVLIMVMVHHDKQWGNRWQFTKNEA